MFSLLGATEQLHPWHLKNIIGRRKLNMAEDRLYSKLKAGKLAIGCSVRRGAYLVEHLARGGFDYFANDMMHGGLDWAEAEHMVVAGKLHGISPTIRVNSMPWSGSTEPDRHLPAEIARAVSLGYTMVKWSFSSLKEVEQCIRMSSDWHRNVNPETGAGMLESEKQGKESVLVVPVAESIEAINMLEEVMQVDGVRAVRIAGTDGSIAAGHPFEYDHPDVWRLMDKAIFVGWL